jgi:hypothetical protein
MEAKFGGRPSVMYADSSVMDYFGSLPAAGLPSMKSFSADAEMRQMRPTRLPGSLPAESILRTTRAFIWSFSATCSGVRYSCSTAIGIYSAMR